MIAGIKDSLEQIIGNTPLYHLYRWEERVEATAFVFAKLEFMNPLGSVKDRAALEMIETAEKQGILREGATIIEPTSGNTGIALAGIARTKGYRVILTMPDTMNRERVNILTAYGAEVILTEGVKGMKGAVDKSMELLRKVPNAILLGQFANMANVEAHYKTTGPEIWEAADGHVDVLVAGVGTGGTITGTAKYLKEMNPRLEVVAVEPKDSPLLTKGESGPHDIHGIGPNFYPKILDTSILDQAITVSTEEAYRNVKEILDTEGLLVGISSGAAICAARQLARKAEYAGKSIVVILPDSGERYLSTDCFREERI